MPAPKAFLRDMHDFKLDPKVAYTKGHLGPDGRMKDTRTSDAVEPVVTQVLEPFTNVDATAIDPDESMRSGLVYTSSDEIVTPLEAVEVPTVTIKASTKTKVKSSKKSTAVVTNTTSGEDNSGKNAVESDDEKPESTED